jgi:hypothetical protein
MRRLRLADKAPPYDTKGILTRKPHPYRACSAVARRFSCLDRLLPDVNFAVLHRSEPFDPVVEQIGQATPKALGFLVPEIADVKGRVFGRLSCAPRACCYRVINCRSMALSDRKPAEARAIGRTAQGSERRQFRALSEEIRPYFSPAGSVSTTPVK